MIRINKIQYLELALPTLCLLELTEESGVEVDSTLLQVRNKVGRFLLGIHLTKHSAKCFLSSDGGGVSPAVNFILSLEDMHMIMVHEEIVGS